MSSIVLDISVLVKHYRGGARMISEGVRFNKTAILISRIRTGQGKQASDQDILFATHPAILHTFTGSTRIPRKAASHLLGQKSQEQQSERGY